MTRQMFHFFNKATANNTYYLVLQKINKLTKTHFGLKKFVKNRDRTDKIKKNNEK